MKISIENIMRWFRLSVEKAVDIVTLVGGAGLIIFILAVNVEVFRRYLFNDPSTWIIEVTSYLLVLFTYSAMAYALKVDAHVTIDLFFARLSEKGKKICNAVSYVLTLLYWALVTWQSLRVALQALARDHRSETLLNFPLFYPLVLVSIGAFLVCLQSLSMLSKRFSFNGK